MPTADGRKQIARTSSEKQSFERSGLNHIAPREEAFTYNGTNEIRTRDQR
jgi:hypothetical protein